MANTLFAVFAVSEPEKLRERLESLHKQSSFGVAPGQWLVVAPSSVTTKELCDSLGVSSGETSNAIVVRVENYFGRATSDIWEWIVAKMGAELAVQNV